MNEFSRRFMLFWSATLLVIMLIAPAGQASAERDPNPGVIPPDARYGGMTYGEWNDAWIQWVMGIPVDPAHPEQYPLFDTTGAVCTAGTGQSGKVWFLAGYGYPVVGPVTRNCTIPHGKALFFPILNSWCDTTPPACGANYHEMIDPLKQGLDQVTTLSAAIDGVPLEQLSRYRGTSPDLFNEVLPDHNLWQYFGCTECTAGTWQAVADGYYLMLAPLSTGHHIIHFYGEFPAGGVEDVTYNLAVGH
jgi:hypothetical protein